MKPRTVQPHDDLLDLFPTPRYFQIHFRYLHDNTENLHSEIEQLKSQVTRLEGKLDKVLTLLNTIADTSVNE